MSPCCHSMTGYFHADDRIYIEHRYLYDADDIRQQRAGSAFLEQHSMADLELVHSSEVYHSLAEVIDGECISRHQLLSQVTSQHVRCLLHSVELSPQGQPS